jgi:glycosyltransferase involved in cell wall biosynthesis
MDLRGQLSTVTGTGISRRLTTAAPTALTAVTPLILSLNEAENIERTLAALSWASTIVVVDSGSTDGTLAILARYPVVTVVHRQFDNHTNQWNYGLDQIGTEWVLTLDADYVLSPEFVREMALSLDGAKADGYFVPFTYCIDGHPLRGTLYPPRLALFRVARGRYEADGHTQRLRLNGRSETMKARIRHDDRKPPSRWIEAQHRYARLEAEKLRATPIANLSFGDRMRRAGAATPFLVFVYCLFARGLILDGSYGIRYAFQRWYAERLLSRYLSQR